MDLPITNEPETISSLPQVRKPQVRFSKDKPTEHLVTAYSNVYGVHPSRFVFNIDGRMIRLKPNDDKFAGVSFEELKQRKDDVNYDTEARAKILRKTLLDGPDWEEDTAD